MQRRNCIVTGVAMMTTAIAGCATTSDEDVLDPDTDASDFLPNSDDWPLDEAIAQDEASVGASDGIMGLWDGPEGEHRYTMVIMRFDDEETAERIVEDEYGDWDLNLQHGVFTFAVNGENTTHARDLLADSPALDEDIVDEKT
ncbi:hypothetical protein [Natronobacterium gregoryi]|uniref:Uncharacterized protein n=2 Tax=Natronobacterium gregoryi TaxID=44930 RepID=L0AH04_NATGS|nr:hypothetical protein [Natronobacterium gregoryi]AFZ72699.1 hypothetical protein Natgr_1490 [Natronobacterium gregoryi SP2]ELY69008.1 hypothetical protein C490_08456 [Natronobacterium gregoryi SP2]PLK20650.1 hypothetical protein CYV19_08620 [Natronobacterium gregoryi SP2]SFI91965.1 hypothetical protein SAMN05443661_10981 [Natronobacterium gregoryi]